MNVRTAVILVGVLVIAGGLILWASSAKPPETSVVRVTEKNPELQKAAEEARDTLPAFIDRLQGRQDEEQFAIRAKFETEAGPEYLWLRDPVYTEGSFQAVVDQRPMVADVKEGDTVTVPEENVFDWMIKSEDNLEGGFTEKALENR